MAVAPVSLRMRVRLTKKYAEEIDGVDLRGCHVGDTVDMPREKARLVLAEDWAMPERRSEDRAPSVPAKRHNEE